MSTNLFPHEFVGCGLMICTHTGSGKKDWGFLTTPCPSSILNPCLSSLFMAMLMKLVP